MNAAQLETMADAILNGSLSVERAEQMLGGKVVHTPTLGEACEPAPQFSDTLAGKIAADACIEAHEARCAHVRVIRKAAADHWTYWKHARVTRPADDRLWPGEEPLDVVGWQRKRVIRVAGSKKRVELRELLAINSVRDADDISEPGGVVASTLREDDLYGPSMKHGPKLRSVRRHARTYNVPVRGDQVVVPPTEKYVAELHSWNDAEFKRLRWPVVAFRPTYRYPEGGRRPLPGDATHGYLADPTWIEGQSRLDAELRGPHTRVTSDWLRDEDGYIILDSEGRKEVTEEATVMGAVEWEYRRRKQGREPWMSKQTFTWLVQLNRTREQSPWMLPERTTFQTICLAEKRRAREYRQARAEQAAQARRTAERSQLIELIREMGGDPKAPEVVAWVKRIGIGTALAKLRIRQDPQLAAREAQGKAIRESWGGWGLD